MRREIAGRPASLRVGRRTIELSRTEKVLFPGGGITKGDLIEYYRRVAPVMLPHLKDRPIAIHRFPDGLRGESFFQKDVPGYFPDWIGRVRVKKQRGTLTHVLCNDAATLVYLANQACVTPHVWLSRKDKLDRPDQMIFDLDPPAHELGPVCDAARTLRHLLEEIGLAAFVKTTGSRGLHVLVPLVRADDFDAVRALARDVTAVAAARDPERLTTEQRKDRRRGRLYLDVMRNAYAQTVAPPYAVRPGPGAPVAVPLDWEELSDCHLISRRYNIANVFSRLSRKDDPWRGMARSARSLSGPRKRLEKLRRQEGA